MLISLDNVGVYRGGKWLVRGISMDVEAGEIVTMIGPNGSGKSTTAKIALGILHADEGIARQKPDLKVGYVPQKLDINWTVPLSVRRFLTLTNRADDAEMQSALEATNTVHLADAQISALSGGEFQRILLARAIIRSPDLLVLDEPVQGVDFNGEIALYKLIETIRNRLNCGILLISHDLHVVMSTTDRVICLNGHVCCSGTPANVATSEEFKSLFGDHAVSSLAFYEHNHDHVHLPDGRVKPHSHSHNHSHSHDSAAGLQDGQAGS